MYSDVIFNIKSNNTKKPISNFEISFFVFASKAVVTRQKNEVNDSPIVFKSP